MTIPTTWYAVTYEHAVGWDAPRDRRTKTHKYASAEAAGRQIAIVRSHPSHMLLLAVHVSSEIEWTEIDPDTLPVPDTEHVYDWSTDA
jgi:hypothetical protein